MQNFYVTVSVGGCTSFMRTRVAATVNNLPVITATQNGLFNLNLYNRVLRNKFVCLAHLKSLTLNFLMKAGLCVKKAIYFFIFFIK